MKIFFWRFRGFEIWIVKFHVLAKRHWPAYWANSLLASHFRMWSSNRFAIQTKRKSFSERSHRRSRCLHRASYTSRSILRIAFRISRILVSIWDSRICFHKFGLEFETLELSPFRCKFSSIRPEYFWNMLETWSGQRIIVSTEENTRMWIEMASGSAQVDADVESGRVGLHCRTSEIQFYEILSE